ADPAVFFASAPSSPDALLAARKELMADSESAVRFDAAVRSARESNKNDEAALGAWVTGEYKKALEGISDSGNLSLFVQIDSLRELGKTSESADLASKLPADADSALAATALAALADAGRWDELKSLAKSAPTSPDDKIYFNAILSEVAGKYAEACEAYEAIIENNPEHAWARFRLAYRADLHGDDEAAIKHYETLLETRPIPVPALVNLGVLYEDNNEFDKACGCYGAILRRDPNHPRARLYFRDAHESLDMFYDEDLERREDQLIQVLRTPISDFELSVRARNCLTNMDIRTLGDLVSHSEPELLEFKNFGETSLTEIKQVLQTKGLRLGLRRDDGSYVVPDEFDAEPFHGEYFEPTWLGKLTEEQVEALDLQVSALNLSVRCHRALVERLNLQRVMDVLRYSEEDLLALPNFGTTSLDELSHKLGELDLRLRTGRGEEAEEPSSQK
ncbi:MAG TPA: hypothetical protein DDW23_00020, partial [Planctomycetes bacterium]|nr:hypothetical protein [Planctomycetota bacterium]